VYASDTRPAGETSVHRVLFLDAIYHLDEGNARTSADRSGCEWPPIAWVIIGPPPRALREAAGSKDVSPEQKQAQG